MRAMKTACTPAPAAPAETMKGMKKATTPAPAAPVSDASARDEGPAPKRLCRDHDGHLSESAFELYGQLQRRVCATPACTETWIIDDGCEEDLANLYCSICNPSPAMAAVAAELAAAAPGAISPYYWGVKRQLESHGVGGCACDLCISRLKLLDTMERAV